MKIILIVLCRTYWDHAHLCNEEYIFPGGQLILQKAGLRGQTSVAQV